MQSWELPDQFVGILSAVLVVQPSIGGTLGVAWQRIVATLLGCVVGVLCLVLLPAGYGTAAAIALAMLLINAIAALRPEWRFGVVAAVALALGSDSDMLQTAIDRSTSIGLGSVIGALTSLFVWPDRSEQRARRHLGAALRATAQRLDVAVAALEVAAPTGDGTASHAFHARFASAREAVAHAHRHSALDEELRLVERLYNSVVMVSRAAEKSPYPPDTSRDLERDVARARSEAADLIRRLARGEPIEAGQLDDLHTAVSEGCESVLQAETGEQDRLRQSVLIFAFQEVLDCIEQLTGLRRPRFSRARSPAPENRR